MYKEVDVKIEFSDVLEYITDYATNTEIKEIRKNLPDEENKVSDFSGSYVESEKAILFKLAAKKYTLEELEQRLGNKFDLI